MDWISLTCVIVFIVSGQLEGIAAGKPIISSNAEDGIIQAGNELSIFCEGERKVEFSLMKVQNAIQPPCNGTINYDGNTASFFCHNATGRDTGWYACAEEGIPITNTELNSQHNDDNITWIHIFVNSTEPFAIIGYRDIMFTGTEPEVIPCRTTSPDTNVTVTNNDGDLEGVFKPEIGFIPTNETVEDWGGMFITCFAIKNNNEPLDTQDNIQFTLVQKPAEPTPKPEINKTALHHMLWGRDQKITCTVTSSSQTAEFNWTYPESVNRDKLRYPPKSTERTADDKYTISSHLKILNVTKSDSGQYTCRVKTGVDWNKDEANMTFSDPNVFYINISMAEGDESRSIKGKMGETCRWRIKIDTYPEHYELSWSKKNGKENKKIPFTNNTEASKSRHFVLPEDRIQYIEIRNSELSDNGDYVIDVKTKYNRSEIILHLTVSAEPVPKITPFLEYVGPGQATIFLCKPVGYPLANVTWRYTEWPNYPSLDGSRFASLSDFKDLPNEDEFTSVSRLNIMINETGNLTCRSCNDISCVEVNKLIKVSDVKAKFGIITPAPVVEGDNISITCGVSRYLNISDKVEILGWKPSSGLELKNKRMMIRKNKTKFNYLSILQINSVNRSDEGIYICDVNDTSREFEPQKFTLSVAAGRQPKIRNSNMNNSQLVIDTDEKKKDGITLKCLAHGMPEPETIWLKDGKPLPGNHGYEISKDKSEFSIRPFFEPDSGNYTCQVQNRFGKDERSVDIVVKGQSYVIWISLVCALAIIIATIIIYMGVELKRDKRLKKELLAAGLTHFAEGAVECLNPDLNIDDQAELLPYDKKWEFPRERLKLGKQLGSGAFGVVMKAEAYGICNEGETTTVAVKMVRRSAEPSYMKALSSELKIMAHLGQHLNVVNLLGACTKNIVTKRELYVIVEYCRFGNLHNYLQRHRDSFINQIDPSTLKIDLTIGIELLARRDSVVEQRWSRRPSSSFSRSISVRSTQTNSGVEPIDYYENSDFIDINMSPDGGVLSNNSVQPGWRSNYRGDYRDQNLKPICTQDLLCWAWQVSRGMEYLSSRKVLHGDLAARNILLADDDLVKICDFGLAKNMYKDDNYQKKGDSPLPIKWMAVESIRDRIFSTQSDIWSFGIVLWEFFTLAQTPYPGMDAEKQYHRLIEGYRMDKPEYATSEIYDFMQECWMAEPSLRPSFPELVEKLGCLLNDSVRMHFCEQDDTYIEMNKRNLEDGQTDYLTMTLAPSPDGQDSFDQMMEPPPNLDYLPMSPMKTNESPNIFSPRTRDNESHFNFPPTSNKMPINLNSVDPTELTRIQLDEDLSEENTPQPSHEKGAQSCQKDFKTSASATDTNYSNFDSNRHVSNPKNQLQDGTKDSQQDLHQANIENDFTNFPAKSMKLDHYVNLSQEKNNQLKTATDSFSNPIYITSLQP